MTTDPDPCCTPAHITAEDCRVLSRASDRDAMRAALELAADEIERLRAELEGVQT